MLIKLTSGSEDADGKTLERTANSKNLKAYKTIADSS